MFKYLFLILFIINNIQASWDEGLDWQHELEEAKELAIYHKKPIFLFLESKTCFYCPKIREQVFTQKRFQDKIKKYFIPLILDNSLDADSDVENTGQCPPRLTTSMTPAIYFMGPKEEKLSRKGKKHMLIYGMWNIDDLLAWMDDAIKKFENLHGEEYDFKK